MLRAPFSERATLFEKGCIGKEFTLFSLTGKVNENQYDYVAEEINVLAQQEIEPDKFALSAMLNQAQLERAYRVVERFSREHRGQYY
jgi:hypothetical protein